MTKKKEQKRSHHKKIEIKVPLPPDFKVEDAMAVPVPIDHALVTPMTAPPVTVNCIATLVLGWTDDYVLLIAAPGHKLPPISKDGTEVEVTFAPSFRRSPFSAEGSVLPAD